MEEIADAGLAKNIGVRFVVLSLTYRLRCLHTNNSNFQGSLLIDLLRYARIEPAVNQVELHPYLAQKRLVALCKELGIAITAYSSLGPQSYLELGAHHSVPGLLSHNTVTSIAGATGKSMSAFLPQKRKTCS